MEQNIVIGLITSTDYIKQIEPHFDLELIDASAAKMLARWCLDYYKKYNEAPGEAIHDIYIRKVKGGKISDDLAEAIEEDILPALNDKYINSPAMLNSLFDDTMEYFQQQKLSQLSEDISDLVAKGELKEAKQLVEGYKNIEKAPDDVDLGSKEVLVKVKKAFADANQPVLYYPGALGNFWNEHLVKGGFVGIMAPEKRGKTFLLLDMAMRGIRQGRRVAFFQAGDMTESQQLMRISIHLGKRSNKEEYCGPTYIPVKDCIHNQYGTCPTPEMREQDLDIFESIEFDEEGVELFERKKFQDLVDAYEEWPDYKPCYNCPDYQKKQYGAPWLKHRNEVRPLTENDALSLFQTHLINKKSKCRMSTHSNGTLSVAMIEGILNTWEIQHNFVPDIVLIDYADLLIGPGRDERDKQNNIWKALRKLSQERDALIVAPTQTDAQSYKMHTLNLSNFSEDKRKYAHATAVYGLNQDPKGLEKKIGLMRINEILLREGEFDINRQVTVLQKLAMGRPVLGSYWDFNGYSM